MVTDPIGLRSRSGESSSPPHRNTDDTIMVREDVMPVTGLGIADKSMKQCLHLYHYNSLDIGCWTPDHLGEMNTDLGN